MVTHRIMQNIMKTFQRAMKILKYRRLRRNSLMLSPIRRQEGLKFSTAPAFTSSVLKRTEKISNVHSEEMLLFTGKLTLSLAAEVARGSMENVLAVLNLGDLAQAFSKMGMFPVFDLAYYIVSILYLKYEPGSVEVSRRSPVASWLCAMLYCFGSYILADIMLGSSPVDYFQYNSHILLASAVWYLIFYCPLNLFYKCVAFLPVKLVLVALKEVVRTRKIAAGVHHAHHAYHHGYFIMVIVGYVKGSGVALISNFEQLLRGVWRPETNEVLNMS
ncbi:Trimeric intracellular cation channel type A, partial [Xenotaenia resolanae]